MPASLRAVALLGSVLLATAAVLPLGAETVQTTNGTDTFIATSSAMPDLQAPGDVFASGGAVVTKGRVVGDAHVAGFDLDLEAEVAGDLYAAGAAITVRAPVGGDLSTMGFSLRTADTAITTGNVRMLGSTITIDGPVGGSLAAIGGEITLDAAVTGDALLQGGSIAFGPKARIAGTLTYSAPEPVTIPDDVVPAARVVYHKTPPLMDRIDHMRDWGAGWVDGWAGRDMPALPSTFALLTGFLVTLGFLTLLGGALLALAPQRVEGLRLAGIRQPALMVLFGVLGIATLSGLVPVAVMTVIGLPFVPIVVLAILLVWTLGYVLGVYVVALRLYQAFGGREDPAPALRIALLGGGVVAFSLLNFVPVLGWMVNFVLVLFGIGTLSTGVLRALAARIPQEPVAGEPPPSVSAPSVPAG
ncbi:hypothetical protein [Tabrizicola sp.]|uniref:hypothetical protein n=1 Tax=Tabrizicola sp. TaxID=2005166 RepID=UPI002609FCBC|nr:hypothetical protein [Tabrizicola sp.]MDM7931462.1 hypothetical protein [Tabrizicola sp.]